MTNQTHPGLKECRDKQGRWRVYHRLHGKSIRLRAPKHTKEFQREYDAAVAELNRDVRRHFEDPTYPSRWRVGPKQKKSDPPKPRRRRYTDPRVEPPHEPTPAEIEMLRDVLGEDGFSRSS
jgi:hypothetical protein